MTRKVYKSALGKEIDLGALLLQNEGVRAVGNMNVNARGDRLDGSNKVIDPKNRQAQRRYQRTVVSADTPVHTSNVEAKRAATQVEEEDVNPLDTIDNLFADSVQPVDAPEPIDDDLAAEAGGGLAAAIARSRTIKQEKEKTLRERLTQERVRKV
jgi:hypothetical protein